MAGRARSEPWTAIRVAIVAVASALAVLGAQPPPKTAHGAAISRSATRWPWWAHHKPAAREGSGRRDADREDGRPPRLRRGPGRRHRMAIVAQRLDGIRERDLARHVRRALASLPYPSEQPR